MYNYVAAHKLYRPCTDTKYYVITAADESRVPAIRLPAGRDAPETNNGATATAAPPSVREIYRDAGCGSGRGGMVSGRAAGHAHPTAHWPRGRPLVRR